MLNENFSKRFVEFSPNARGALAVFNLIVIFAVGGAASLFLLFLFLPLGLLVLFMTLLSLVFIWWYCGEFLRKFAFELRADHFFSRKGVFKASYTMIRYERIQDIHINQSIFEMLLGLWDVSIYTATATGRGSENIPGLSKDNAEALKTALFQKIKKVRKVVD